MKSQILIFSESVTPRLTYILDFIFGKIIGVTYKITSDFQVFLSSDLPKINYSFRDSDELRVKPSGLLFQKGIEAVDTGYVKWNGMHCLFYNQDGASIPFDLFSASFFLLTRYEEYLPFHADDHGRFSSDQSIAGKHKFLEEPVVQQWAGFLLNILKLNFKNLTEKKQEFKIEPTIDVDVAFAFVYRNFGRFIMSSGRDFTTLKWNRIIDRILVTSKSKKDPFDTYSYIELIHKKYNFPVSIFYLIGDYSHYDRNIPYDSPEVKELIKALSDKFSLGIHPSYKAADSADELNKEINRLGSITGNMVTKSRQHFLRLNFPGTYHKLMQEGITDDYSMGFHDKPGFRAGIAMPYPFYDLVYEKETTLTIHPFAFMERTLKDRLNLDPDMALLKIQELMKKVKSVNGTFGTLWHNDSLSDYGEWKRWRYVYDVMLSMAFTSIRKQETLHQESFPYKR